MAFFARGLGKSRRATRVAYNLRFPGQYYDVETYAYVDSDPVSNADPFGTGPAGGAIGGAIGGWIGGLAGAESGPADAEAVAAGRAIGRAIARPPIPSAGGDTAGHLGRRSRIPSTMPMQTQGLWESAAATPGTASQ